MKENINMGVAFGSAVGHAKKTGLEYIKLEFGENEFRLVGELLPRYAYWKQLSSGGNTFSIPVECLSFNRETEEFDNLEKDWFKHYFPKEKCVWSYVSQVLDKDDNLLLCGLKKKLFDQIQTAMDTLGDPTDYKKGYPIKFLKKKTGPNVYNVEYELLQLKLKPTPLTEAQLEILDQQLKPIDELIPRQKPEQQKAFIEQAWFSKEESNVSDEAIDELKHDEYNFAKTGKKEDDFDADVPM
jgi:hypothetical protein